MKGAEVSIEELHSPRMVIGQHKLKPGCTIEECQEVDQQIRETWKKELEESGKSEVVYLATDRRAVQAITWHEILRHCAKDQLGLDLPPLVEGATVTFTEVEDGC